MKKLILFFFIYFYAPAVFSQIKVLGKVVSEADLKALAGATIKAENFDIVAVTDSAGTFVINIPGNVRLLVVSYVGYRSQKITVPGTKSAFLKVVLSPDKNQLEEITISTGYQKVPKEQIIGSVSQVNNQLLNRTVSTDIISRLDGIVPGMLFNRSGARKINVRGQSTLFGNSEPLIVVDNFPYDGDIAAINPNDVESVTVLKDAAAASIWGARAGNGVIVITTKQGARNQALSVNVNSNVTIGERPDLFYQPVMGTPDFIDVEKNLFSKNFYRSTENSANRSPLSPVVELLIAERDGRISADDAGNEIERLKQFDVRDDYKKYLYRNTSKQQYSANLSGGNAQSSFYLSAGYDRNLESLRENQSDRLTLTFSDRYSALKNKLVFNASIYYTESQVQNNNPGTSLLGMAVGSTTPLYPYAKLADENGNALQTVHGYRMGFVNDAPANGLLDWGFKPLEEIYLADNTSKSVEHQINTALKYTIIPGLAANILYQYNRGINDYRSLRSQQTWYTRNEINKFTSLNADGTLERPVPLGGVLDTQNGEFTSDNFRTQLEYRKQQGKHEVSSIGGFELREKNTSVRNSRLYGYNDDQATSVLVDYISTFPLYYNKLSSSSISSNQAVQELTDRFRSYYGNFSYTYDKRYTFYSSGRIDQSNLFGVKTNQKGVPLWSAGISWDLSQENFYNVESLPYLKLRFSIGYNGSVDKSVSAFTTARYYNGSSYLTKLPYAVIVNPPNPELRWERVKIANFGLDFTLKKEVISGSIEYYRKKGLDLIGMSPYAPSTGITEFTGNYANSKGHGVDIQLNTHNLRNGFKWFSSFLLSYASDKVTHYLGEGVGTNYVTTPASYPMEGKPLYAIYSYAYAGLDPQTGNPQGYLDGQVSQQYSQILAAASIDNIVYHGPSRPQVYGSFLNTFNWRGVSVSANIAYRLGYYFRRESVKYYDVLSGNGGHGDYADRWQKPGDELVTSVPSMPAARSAARDNLYIYSPELVEKGDHVRLQDINVSYTVNKRWLSRSPFRELSFYTYLNNLGVLWKASDANIDPDYPSAIFTPVKTIAFGVKIGL